MSSKEEEGGDEQKGCGGREGGEVARAGGASRGAAARRTGQVRVRCRPSPWGFQPRLWPCRHEATPHSSAGGSTGQGAGTCARHTAARAAPAARLPQPRCCQPAAQPGWASPRAVHATRPVGLASPAPELRQTVGAGCVGRPAASRHATPRRQAGGAPAQRASQAAAVRAVRPVYLSGDVLPHMQAAGWQDVAAETPAPCRHAAAGWQLRLGAVAV